VGALLPLALGGLRAVVMGMGAGAAVGAVRDFILGTPARAGVVNSGSAPSGGYGAPAPSIPPLVLVAGAVAAWWLWRNQAGARRPRFGR
jgi:hypothetical protein